MTLTGQLILSQGHRTSAKESGTTSFNHNEVADFSSADLGWLLRYGDPRQPSRYGMCCAWRQDGASSLRVQIYSTMRPQALVTRAAELSEPCIITAFTPYWRERRSLSVAYSQGHFVSYASCKQAIAPDLLAFCACRATHREIRPGATVDMRNTTMAES